MKVKGISNYYAFMYNRNTGKITPDNETDDGFAEIGRASCRERVFVHV